MQSKLCGASEPMLSHDFTVMEASKLTFDMIADVHCRCIGNIAGDNPQFRDSILTIDDILPSLVRLLQGGPAVSLVRNVVWVMSNLVRGKPRVAWGHAAPFIPVLAQLISASTDEEVLTDAAWALSYISDGEDERGAAVVAAGVIPRLVSLASASATYRVRFACSVFYQSIADKNDCSF